MPLGLDAEARERVLLAGSFEAALPVVFSAAGVPRLPAPSVLTVGEFSSVEGHVPTDSVDQPSSPIGETQTTSRRPREEVERARGRARRAAQQSPPGGFGCPFLGLRADAASIFLEPTPEHRCHVAGGRRRIERHVQVSVCLTTAFERCAPFVTEQRRRPASLAAASMIRDANVSDERHPVRPALI